MTVNQRVAGSSHQQYSDSAFVEGAFEVTATDPKKTLLEKLILLHEEFQKDPEKIRYIRMSRHYYDIDQLFNSEFGASAPQRRTSSIDFPFSTRLYHLNCLHRSFSGHMYSPVLKCHYLLLWYWS